MICITAGPSTSPISFYNIVGRINENVIELNEKKEGRS